VYRASTSPHVSYAKPGGSLREVVVTATWFTLSFLNAFVSDIDITLDVLDTFQIHLI